MRDQPCAIAGVLMAILLPLTACGSSSDDDAKDDTGATPASMPSEGTESSGQTEESEDTGDTEPLPFNASGLLGGNAKPNFPSGEPGEVSVVQVGPLEKDQGILLFAFRNNTEDGISHVDWTATARSGGAIVSTGSSQGTIPAQVPPGEVGLSYPEHGVLGGLVPPAGEAGSESVNQTARRLHRSSVPAAADASVRSIGYLHRAATISAHSWRGSGKFTTTGQTRGGATWTS